MLEVEVMLLVDLDGWTVAGGLSLFFLARFWLGHSFKWASLLALHEDFALRLLGGRGYSRDQRLRVFDMK